MFFSLTRRLMAALAATLVVVLTLAGPAGALSPIPEGPEGLVDPCHLTECEIPEPPVDPVVNFDPPTNDLTDVIPNPCLTNPDLCPPGDDDDDDDGPLIDDFIPVPQVERGYWMADEAGNIYEFGDAAAHFPVSSAVALTTDDAGETLWVLDTSGDVHVLGTGVHHGDIDPGDLLPGETATTIAATPDGNGYWIFTDLGRAIAFGDADFHGDMLGIPLNGGVIAAAATATGEGYWMVGADGGIFSFGDATFHGSMGGVPLNSPVVGIAADPDEEGYWLVAADGGIFAFAAEFKGSMGDTPLNQPVVGALAYGDGYLLVAADGGIFSFSSTPFLGSLGNNPPATPVVGVAAYTRWAIELTP